MSRLSETLFEGLDARVRPEVESAKGLSQVHRLVDPAMEELGLDLRPFEGLGIGQRTGGFDANAGRIDRRVGELPSELDCLEGRWPGLGWDWIFRDARRSIWGSCLWGSSAQWVDHCSQNDGQF